MVFKNRVLSKFVVSVPFGKVREFIDEESRLTYKMEDRLDFICDERILKKIKDYCHDIFVVDFGYDNERGVIAKEDGEKDFETSNIL